MRPGWEIRPLREVCAFDKAQSVHRGLPYVGLEHIESHTGRFIGSMDPQPVRSSTFRFSSDHVLYGRLRPYLNKVLAPDFEGHCSTEIFPIKPGPSLVREYLLYWLLADETTNRINATCTGARMPRADMNELLDFPFPLPPLAEQKRIVRVLDEALDGIATAKANAEKNLEDAREIFESERHSILAAGGKSWPVKTLDELAENLDSRRVPITKGDRKPGKYPYYGASGIVDYVADYIFEGDALLISEDGANLLARSTPIAFPVSGKYWVNNHAHVLRFQNLATQRFVECHLESVRLDKYITGAAQPKLTQAALNRIPIPIPSSVNEQVEVVRRFDSLQIETTRLAALYEKKQAALEGLKKAALQEAFTGGP
jgi:type I restriction enzyme, S subunit